MLALEHPARRGGQFQGAKRLGVGPQMSERNELAHHAAPLLFVQLGSNPEHRKLVVPELCDALGGTTDEHVNEIRSPKSLADPVHAGQGFLRRHRAVPKGWWSQTVVAVAAANSIRRFAEVAKQADTSTIGGFA